MDKKALINSGRLQLPYNDRTDKNFIAQPKINLQSFKSIPDSLKQRFKEFGRKPSLDAPERCKHLCHGNVKNGQTYPVCDTLGLML